MHSEALGWRDLDHGRGSVLETLGQTMPGVAGPEPDPSLCTATRLSAPFCGFSADSQHHHLALLAPSGVCGLETAGRIPCPALPNMATQGPATSCSPVTSSGTCALTTFLLTPIVQLENLSREGECWPKVAQPLRHGRVACT